jgi:flagellar biosynthesis/type III secretory pathway protein FliH
MDYRSGMGTARDEGLAIGRSEGMTIGYKQARLEIARKMKARGWLLADIAENTDLPFDAIEKL